MNFPPIFTALIALLLVTSKIIGDIIVIVGMLMIGRCSEPNGNIMGHSIYKFDGLDVDMYVNLLLFYMINSKNALSFL
ncbi:hypothetical protein [Metabacillus sediminilitoris]|uniref:Uncharacterized protein n=1 Tax=Metabacillus sediminilitoris TaxID=2567941 RepID=A0A4S4BXW4_9BACI|nr:hypothetical protein [Metabacillus sediminilitoris]QGQ44449.1 hypothetical protein GMB29_03750 [Metabacillus sediminilitoris]THF80072.1 hypothetical protein E6W99_10365 [Metabacillus sediminilitoris]